jgi:citrate lyase subunit gamma (acyl carrier protein)
MDCMVVVEEAPSGSGVSLTVSGGGRFQSAIDRTVRQVLTDFGLTDAIVHVQDHGAWDVVVAARAETACARLSGPEEEETE